MIKKVYFRAVSRPAAGFGNMAENPQ